MSDRAKVLIIYPPNAGVRPGIEGISYPMGLSYIAAVLKDNYDVSGYDFNFHFGIYGKVEREDILNILRKKHYDFLLVSGVFPKFRFIKELIELSREVSRAPIIVGGSFIQANLGIVKDFIMPDYYVMGEGEESVVKLLGRIYAKELVDDVPGVFYYSGEKLVSTTPPQTIRDLDNLPFPRRDILNYYYYKRTYSLGNPLLYMAVMISSRGCPFNCVFCRPNFGRHVRTRSPENIVEEIRMLQKDYNVNFIYFQDEILLGGNKKKIKTFCEYVISKANDRFYWKGTTNARFLDRETVILMKRAGCTGINLGVESMSPAILKEMRKKNDLEQLRDVVYACTDNGIDVGFSMITNSFSETEETLNETKRNLMSYSHRFFRSPSSINFLVPIPGTDLYDEAKMRNLISDNDLENLLLLDDASRYGLSLGNLTAMSNDHFIDLVANINRELSEDYWSKHRFQQVVSKYTNLYHFRLKETMESLSIKNVRANVEGLLWALSKGGTRSPFIEIYKKMVYGNLYLDKNLL